MAWRNKGINEISHKAPVLVDLLEMLYQNPISMAAGEAGSPSVLPNIGENAATNTKGTYVFARYTGGGNVSYGSTVAGSNLTPTSAMWSVESGDATSGFDVAAALSGTWMCMGLSVDEQDMEPGPGVTLAKGATLWVKKL